MQNLYVIQLHFHGRRTGVTRSVENIMPGLRDRLKAVLYGYGVEGPKINLRQLLKIVFGHADAVIHAHRNIELLFALVLRLLGAKFKLVATRHAESKPSSLTVWLLKKADAVVALIPTLQLPMPTVVIGHGIDTSYFVPNDQVKWPGLAQKKIVSVVGRVRKAKGQHVFIEAIAPLLKENPDWAVLVVGQVDDDEYKAALESVIKEHHVEDQVHFIPETRDILSVYQVSHVVVVASFSEGFSLVPVEAMACQCLVVATSHVGIHSAIINHQENGFLFEKGNVQQLQACLQVIFSHDLNSMTKQARATVIAHWDVVQQVEKLKNLYTTLVADGRV